MNTTFGTDPEFILYNDRRSSSPVSAISVLNGHGKENKLDIGKGFKIFYDNVQLELNMPPVNSSANLVENLSFAFSQIKNVIKPCRFLPFASAIFPNTELEHPDAKVFGCDPEYCCYELQIIQPPTAKDGFRSAGGHIHLGGPIGHNPLNLKVTDEDCEKKDWGRIWTIRMMDLFVGLTGIVMDQDMSSAARRKLYGQAGSNRIKDYGVEYRSMGNFWLTSPELTQLVYDLSMAAVECVRNGVHLEKLWKNTEEAKYPVADVRKAINTTNKKMARKLLDQHVKPLLSQELFLRVMAMSEVCSNNTNGQFYNNWNM